MLVLSTNVDQKSLKTEFSTGDKWQSKTLFLLIFDLHSSIVKIVLDCRQPGAIVFHLLSGVFVKQKCAPSPDFKINSLTVKLNILLYDVDISARGFTCN